MALLCESLAPPAEPVAAPATGTPTPPALTAPEGSDPLPLTPTAPPTLPASASVLPATPAATQEPTPQATVMAARTDPPTPIDPHPNSAPPVATVNAPATTPAATPAATAKHQRRVVPLEGLRELVQRELGFDCACTTLWRLLDQHALRPWTYRYWIFPRDPKFLDKASPILDLYQGIWQGQPLQEGEYVLSVDEKTSIQARLRLCPTVGAKPGQPAWMEFEYTRMGALQYLAAWDVHRGQIFGRCEVRTGIAAFHRLVEQVLQEEPYRSAKRIFVIVDNGSSHRGVASVRRVQERFPNVVLLHLPVHASWLNQVEIYFSIIQRVLLQPNDYPHLEAVAEALQAFATKYNATAQPFAWHFQRADLEALLKKVQRYPLPKGAAKKSRQHKTAQAQTVPQSGKTLADPVCQ